MCCECNATTGSKNYVNSVNKVRNASDFLVAVHLARLMVQKIDLSTAIKTELIVFQNMMML